MSAGRALRLAASKFHAPLRLGALHQPPCLAADLPLEILHSQAVLPPRPVGEILPRCMKAIVATEVYHETELGLPSLHRFPGPPLPRLGDDKAFHFVTTDRPANLLTQPAGIGGGIDGDIVDAYALPTKLLGEVTHS